MITYYIWRCRTPYLGSVSVLLTELLKLAICLAVQLRSCRAGAIADGVSVVKACRKQLQTILEQSLPMLLPAAMFVMQQVCSAKWGCRMPVLRSVS